MNSDSDMFKLILVDPNIILCKAFSKAFRTFEQVEIVNGYFEELKAFDCMVSAANSFGLMDGGVDGAITRFFGYQLMSRVQQHIIDHFYGEQPVGTSFIIETKQAQHPYLAHTPTMRIPLSIKDTDHVYLAMFAMLRTVAHFNKANNVPIKIVACPGLGTATGQVPPDEAARQMALAYRNFLNPPKSIHWSFANKRYSEIIDRRG